MLRHVVQRIPVLCRQVLVLYGALRILARGGPTLALLDLLIYARVVPRNCLNVSIDADGQSLTSLKLLHITLKHSLDASICVLFLALG